MCPFIISKIPDIANRVALTKIIINIKISIKNQEYKNIHVASTEKQKKFEQ